MDSVASNLWVGNLDDATKSNLVMERLCVLEGCLNYPGMTYQIPILLPYLPGMERVKDDYHKTSDISAYASRRQLDLAADLISARLADGKELLVHCAAGIERSPLTCAWWMVKTGRHSTLDAAYAHLKLIRPIIEDRQFWLEPIYEQV